MRNEDPEMLVRWEVFRSQMRKRRLEMGLTQHELSQRMDRSQDFVSILENSERSIPNLTTVWLWLDALELDFEVAW